MLQKLSIYNYAIIDELVIDFATGLTTMTGETGAGKSIILGALSLILGERADTSVLINKEKKCIVEAAFDVSSITAFSSMLDEEDIDQEEQCIIRREISPKGKSRAFVNDTPVRLDVLNKLSAMLVDLHQQFDHLALDDSSFQMDVVDAVANNSILKKTYVESYKQYTSVTRKLSDMLNKRDEWQKEADYKQYLFDELESVSFTTGELESAEKELKQLTHAESISGVLNESVLALEQSEQPLLNELKKVINQLEGVSSLMPELEDVVTRLNSTHIELSDIASELESIAGNVTIDNERILKLEERIDVGYKLLKKHSVATTDELIEIQSRLEEELKHSLDIENEIEQLESTKEKLLSDINSIGGQLTQSRASVIDAFSSSVNNLLGLVGMPNAIFKVELSELPQPSLSGLDSVEFNLDANKSGVMTPVYKAASGGELSRIMLCIKSLTSEALQLPTLIFDEVDTGISGEAAKQVGVLLQSLGKEHQLICITHQPQVAARGNAHMYVYKEPDTEGRISTKVKTMTDDERIVAIAKMIGGEQPGAAAIQNAKEIFSN